MSGQNEDLAGMKQLCDSYLREIDSLDGLIERHSRNQETTVIKTFKVYLNKMIGQLNAYRQKFEQIDTVIRKEPAFTHKESQLAFFREQCQHLNCQNLRLREQNNKLETLIGKLSSQKQQADEVSFKNRRRLDRFLRLQQVATKSRKSSSICRNCTRLSESLGKNKSTSLKR